MEDGPKYDNAGEKPKLTTKVDENKLEDGPKYDNEGEKPKLTTKGWK